MVDMEEVAYKALTAEMPEVEWSASYPQEFLRHGVITQKDNSIRTASTKKRDHISNVAVEIQSWYETPEERNAAEKKIDEIMLKIGIRRSTVNHLTDTQNDRTVLYRSVVLYAGVFDNNTERFYFN